MADNSVISRSGLAGLFGIPGVDMRQQQEEKDAFARAQLSPMQQLSARAIGQGKAAGRELAGLFGAEDPVMKEQSVARQARVELQQRGLQPNTPEFWDTLTVRLGELGAPNAQAEASNIGMQVKEKLASIGQKRGENLNTLLGSGKYTPESLGIYAKTRNPSDLQVIDKGLSGTVLEKVAGAEQNIQNLSAGNAEIDSFLSKVDPKNPTVTFGPLSTIGGGLSRLVGGPTKNALEQDKMRRFISREANAILVAAKGTQTEGDAQRAYDMIISGLDKNSNEGVRDALEDLKDMKSTTVKGLQTYVNTIQNKGKPSTAPVAPLKPSATIKAQADAIRAKNPGLTGYTDEQLVQLALKQSKK